MKKGVGVKGRFHTKKIILLVLTIVITSLFIQGVSATLIIPQNIELEDFSSAQEQVITIINDQFEPIACEMNLNYLSLYMQEFVVFEPERFILQPGEQKNVKVISSFSSDMPPQTHKLIIHSSKTNKGNSTITFRPEGNKKSSLNVIDVHESSENNTVSEDMIVSLQLENVGNTILFVTPILEIRQNNYLIKEIVYPQPLILLAGESYPLTLRQDTSGLEEGTYQIVVRAVYQDNEESFFSEDQRISYVLSRTRIEEGNSSNQRNIVIGLIIGALATIGIIWFRPKNGHVYSNNKNGERFVSNLEGSPTINVIKGEIHHLKKEISFLTKEVSLLVEKAENLKQNKNR